MISEWVLDMERKKRIISGTAAWTSFQDSLSYITFWKIESPYFPALIQPPAFILLLAAWLSHKKTPGGVKENSLLYYVTIIFGFYHFGCCFLEI